MAKRGKAPSRARRKEELVRSAASTAMPRACDVAVIGGGAAGLVAAACAAEAGARVVVLERDLECGRKILATGNGRCNFANERLDPARYNDPAFVRAACGDGAAWLGDVLAFWRGCGLAWTSEEGRLYPASLQAASVRNVLLARARRAGAALTCGRAAVWARSDSAGGAAVGWEGAEPGIEAGELRAGRVVLACGGGAELAGALGLEAAPWSPVLCPLAAEPLAGAPDLAEVDGRRARCRMALLRKGEEIWAEDGEALFRAQGLSGIAAFDLSRRARPGDVVRLDLTGGRGEAELEALAAAGGADGVLDPAIAAALGGGLRALKAARGLDFKVTGLMDTNKAQVMRGGLATAQFDPATLAAKGAPWLHACGEALDVDGDCGGFNLAWAWKSGMVAGLAAARGSLGKDI